MKSLVEFLVNLPKEFLGEAISGFVIVIGRDDGSTAIIKSNNECGNRLKEMIGDSFGGDVPVIGQPAEDCRGIVMLEETDE